jgi:hypothetical protein
MKKFLIIYFILMLSAVPVYAKVDVENKPRKANLLKQTGYLGGLSLTAMAALWVMPADNSQWYDKPSLAPASLGASWRNNVSSGPVWDGDMRIFNGYGHVHSGAAYTMLCLGNGLSDLACTTYANLASLAWEFGPEALVEIPSFQDILMTGMIGSRVGIQFFRWQKKIRTNQGMLLGSRALGSFTNALMDPLSSFINMMPGIDTTNKTSIATIPLLIPRPSESGKTGWTFGYSLSANL